MLQTLPFLLLLSIILGGVIGLGRENKNQGGEVGGAAGGIRTFALICLLGALSGVFYVEYFPVFVFITSLLSLFLVSYYILGSLATKHVGLTNEISILYTFLIGFLLTTDLLSMQLVIALFVVFILILAFKEESKKIIGGISRAELQSFISYAIIALVVLPFLPNVGYTISDVQFIYNLLTSYNINLGEFATLEIINPRKIWFIVVLVTGIDVFGYLLGKFIGHKRSFTLASFFGGFVSSTATTQALAQRSKRTKMTQVLVGAALLANMASFFQVFLLVGPLNARWLLSITPTLFIIILSAAALSVFFFYHHSLDSAQDDLVKEEKKIFSLIPAVKFALLLISVKLLTKICLIVFGESGFILSSIIASFVGLDAIVINLADMAGETITFKFALLTFILVNATNLLSKTVYSFVQGSRPFAIRLLISTLVIIAMSFLGLFFIA